jgi:hypothetical protein
MAISPLTAWVAGPLRAFDQPIKVRRLPDRHPCHARQMTSIEMCAVGVSAPLSEGMGAAKATVPVCTARLKLTPISAKDVDDLALLHIDPLVAFSTGPWSRATIKAWAEGMTVR